MDEKPPIVFAIVFVLFWMLCVFFTWFRPKQFSHFQNKRREKYKRGDLISNLNSFVISFYRDKPVIEIWTSRIVAIIGLLIAILILYSAIS